jgi:hypothetical protein
VAFKSTDFKGHFVICRKERPMNIKFSYLYRDGANYKQFNEVVFSNPNNLTGNEIEATIKKQLIDSEWFVAKDWKLPDMRFKEYAWDSEIDHDWHEFESIEETLEQVTTGNKIEHFLLVVTKTKLPW